MRTTRAALAAFALCLGLLAPSVAGAAPGGVTSPEVLKGLAAVRRATAKYHDVQKALDDGYISLEHCIEEPGLGSMGIHFINPTLAGDLESDPLQPELLLYAPTEDGLRLVGVEYFQANAGQPTPTILGQAFNGPMPGHEPGMPEHYDLHLWLWQANPAGLFAPFNPNVTCG